MVSKKVMGYSRCGIPCGECYDNYDKKLKHGCERYPQKITNPDGVDDEYRIKQREKYRRKKQLSPKKVCPKCGANMVYKSVKGYRYTNNYFKCPKCRWLERVK